MTFLPPIIHFSPAPITSMNPPLEFELSLPLRCLPRFPTCSGVDEPGGERASGVVCPGERESGEGERSGEVDRFGAVAEMEEVPFVWMMGRDSRTVNFMGIGDAVATAAAAAFASASGPAVVDELGEDCVVIVRAARAFCDRMASVVRELWKLPPAVLEVAAL